MPTKRLVDIVVFVRINSVGFQVRIHFMSAINLNRRSVGPFFVMHGTHGIAL